ncbi:MAG: hypothetical protein M1818_002777 [Claussenomyces sp. TS43310]|nr:MAG: hypothetical protein M1818_002777 [Claussenomyces sp. TS43310]
MDQPIEHLRLSKVLENVLRRLLDSTIFTLSARIVGCIALILVGICGGTFLFTSLRFHLEQADGRRFTGTEPPTLPYFIPWIGSALEMIRDPHVFYQSTLRRSRDGRPARLRIGPIHMYLIMGADNIQAIFRNSKHLSFEFMQLRIAQKVKGLPAKDALKLGVDDSGTGSTPLVDIPSDARIWHKLHGIYLSNLTEMTTVNFLTNKFVAEFSDQLDLVPSGRTLTLPIYDFLQFFQFTASTNTLVGPRILESNPNFIRAFWDYDAAFMTLLQGAPRFWARKGWDARDQCLRATKEWLASATSNLDADLTAKEDPDWEQNFGHRLMRTRNQALVDYGVSFEGRAAMHMGLIWAINANAIPMTAYMLIELILRPSLLQRVRDELTSAVLPSPDAKTSLNLDIRTIASLPLLNAIYNECLRLHSSIPISRRLRSDIEIDGYTLRAGNFILAPSWLSHIDDKVWATPEHPAGEFWAERFMQKEREKTKLGDFCPYGGGSVICPGRFFAKHEILSAVAMMVTRFEFEFVKYVHLDGRDSDRGPGMERAESRGIVSLDRDVVVKMRKVG